jgi:hypothetical protein
MRLGFLYLFLPYSLAERSELIARINIDLLYTGYTTFIHSVWFLVVPILFTLTKDVILPPN